MRVSNKHCVILVEFAKANNWEHEVVTRDLKEGTQVENSSASVKVWLKGQKARQWTYLFITRHTLVAARIRRRKRENSRGMGRKVSRFDLRDPNSLVEAKTFVEEHGEYD